MTKGSRLLFAICTIVALVWSSAGAMAAFPERPIRLICSIAAGGSADTLARLLAQKLSEKWGQPVVVENREGANGAIAENFVKNSAADGYTLAFVNNTRTIPALEKDSNFDPVAGLAPVAFLEQHPGILVINPDSVPVNSLKELIEYDKANPGKLNFGTVGANTPPYLVLSYYTGMRLTKVMYAGTSKTLVALLGGEIQVTTGSVLATVPQIQAGKLKALAVSSSFEIPQLPGIPTFSEALGIPGIEEGTWTGILAPAGTPKEIVDQLNAALMEAMNTPEVKEISDKNAWFPKAMTGDEFGEFLRADTAKMKMLLEAVGSK